MEYKDINSLEDVQTYIQQGNSLNGSQIFALTRKLGRSESVIRDAMKGTLPQDADSALSKAAAGVDTQAPMSFLEAKRLLNQPVSSGPKTSTPTTKEVQDFSIFGDDAEYMASAVKSLEQAKIPKTLSEGINLLRKYDSPQPISSAEKEVVKTSIDSLNQLLNNGTITQGEFNAFSNALEVVDTETVTTGGNQYWFRYDSGSYGTSTLSGLPDNASWVWDLPEFTGSQEDYTIDKFGDFTSLVQSITPDFKPSGEPSGGGATGGGAALLPPGGIQLVDLNNVPRDAYVWNVDNQLYVAYEVPGAGDVYDGPPIYMAYEVFRNDLVEAGLWTSGETLPTISPIRKEDFDRVAILFSGDTNQLTSEVKHPFSSFTERIKEQEQVAPWITDPDMIALIAEAAVEGRDIRDDELQTTNWYKTHNESEREWLRTYYADPSTATQLTTDSQIAVANSLQAAGVSNAPEALINWVAGKYVSGEWSQTYTTEQISLFADPYATGKRDAQFENYLSSTALTGVDRTTEREREVRELYGKWLGPTLGKLTDEEAAEIAGRLRDDPDYQDQLVQSLKQSRLAAFSNYTNPELTYEDIARPWRNLTTSVWGQTADETQGWWQEMVKSNDFAQAQNTLREKGLEQDVTQVTQDATQALQQALGQGTVSQSGVNV